MPIGWLLEPIRKPAKIEIKNEKTYTYAYVIARLPTQINNW